jgi:WD40 repeat protein
MWRYSLIIFVFLLSALAVSAQGSATGECGHDPLRLQAAIETDGWVFDDLIQFYWSPNCRYLSMRLPSRFGDPGKTITWDAQTNTRVGVIEGFAIGGYAAGGWDETGEYLVLPVNEVGTYLWHVPSNRQMLLNDFECGLTNTTWDYERGQLYATSPIEWGNNWCSPYIHVGNLRVYDLNTGSTITQYPIDGYTLDYEFSDDGHYMILTGYGWSDVPVQVWDRSNGQMIAAVDIDEGGGISHSREQIEISPDGRYLAIGMLYLRIWDLTTLPADLDMQTPSYRYEGPSSRIRGIHFVDAQTIETRVWGSETQRWDVVTGAEIP